MPELPEVETVRRALVPALENRRVVSAHIGRPDLRWPLPENLAARLTGRRFGALRRRGKFLLLPLDGDETMLMHLGMSGSVRLHDRQLPIMQTHRSRHAEMHQHRFITVERQKQEFPPPPQRTETPSSESRREVLGKRPPQIGPADMGGNHTPVLQRRHKRPAHRFNLGKFGHG